MMVVVVITAVLGVELKLIELKEDWEYSALE